MSSGPNNGAAFTFDANAVLCPAVGNPKCFPDQEHIAADPMPSSGGNDQIYLVYRHFTPSLWGQLPPWDVSFYPFPSITCSADNGKTWLPPAPIAAGDDARVIVGGDEFVWVVQRVQGVIVVSKFSSCETGLQPQLGFPKNVVSVSDPFCPVLGLDRCSGDALSSAMIAVDQTDPTHIFIAYANSTSSSNDDVLVTDTTDAFATAPNNLRTVTVSGAAVGRRYMPWICTLGANAQVAWYDRRAATTTAPDLTAYFRGSASVVGGTVMGGRVVGGTLASGAEVNVSGVNDAQCAPGFPCGARSADLVNSCPRPHNDGTCLNSSGTGSKTLCDRDLKVCPAGEACVANLSVFPTGLPEVWRLQWHGLRCGSRIRRLGVGDAPTWAACADRYRHLRRRAELRWRRSSLLSQRQHLSYRAELQRRWRLCFARLRRGRASVLPRQQLCRRQRLLEGQLRLMSSASANPDRHNCAQRCRLWRYLA